MKAEIFVCKALLFCAPLFPGWQRYNGSAPVRLRALRCAQDSSGPVFATHLENPLGRVRQCVLGWSDFWSRKKFDTFHAVPNCYKTPIPKFHYEMLLFGLAQGLWKFDCYLKMDINKNVQHVFGACARGECPVFFDLFKTKNAEN